MTSTFTILREFCLGRTSVLLSGKWLTFTVPPPYVRVRRAADHVSNQGPRRRPSLLLPIHQCPKMVSFEDRENAQVGPQLWNAKETYSRNTGVS